MSKSDNASPRAPRVALVSLGCPKNQVDSELILGRFVAEGAEIVDDPEQADTLVVNTCSFIDRAREESVETLLQAEDWKQQREGRRLIAAGCLVQRSGQELADEIPAIDGFVGLDDIQSSGQTLAQARQFSAGMTLPVVPAAVPATTLFDHSDPRQRLSPPWSAFVKIAEGCDQKCSFCAIPSFRGRMRSRSLEDLSQELRQLAAEGVLEANLIAQDSTGYGQDIGIKDGLAKLLETLDALDQAPPWIRVHYLYPGKISRRLIEIMGAAQRIVPYVDLPLQHADREILRRMRRPGNATTYFRHLEQLREAMPGAGVRSAVIVGFPGEREEHFQRLVEFVSEAAFDSLGIFTYSHEESTTALEFEDDVPAELKLERQAQLEEVFLAAAHNANETRIGDELTVLTEGAAEDEPDAATARWAGQAPEVDGRILLPGAADLPAGRFAQVRIVEAAPLELVGEVLPDEGGA